MSKLNAKDLLEKLAAGTINEKEKAMLDSWYLQWKHDDLIGLTEEDYLQAEQKIGARLPQPPKKRRLWAPRLQWAAALVTVVLGTGIFYIANQPKKSTGLAQGIDISPGQMGATLTLANGKKILLTKAAKGQLAQEAGVTIMKTAAGELTYVINGENSAAGYHTLSTQRGQQFAVQLPDGSKVWLNAASTLKYPANFTAMSTRMVELEGEGYFEAAKDPQHPFLVNTVDQQVEVLGTHFNVSAYGNGEMDKTTLLEGTVRIIGKARNGTAILKPGQQASINQNGILVRQVDAEDAIAWKNGFFVFDSERLEDIMQQVSRWYNVDIHYASNELKERRFSGSVSRFAMVSKLLSQLEQVETVKFNILKEDANGRATINVESN